MGMGQESHQTPGAGKSRPTGPGSRGSLQRKGKLGRGGLKERQRLPHPAPRPNKIKNQHTRWEGGIKTPVIIPLSLLPLIGAMQVHYMHDVSE